MQAANTCGRSGRKGQGPGEFQMPGFVQVTSQGEIAVYDFQAQRLVFFSPDGHLPEAGILSQDTIPRNAHSAGLQGNIVGYQVMAPPPIGGLDIAKYDPDYVPLFVIAHEEPDKAHREGEFALAKPGLVYAVSPNDTIVWGNSAVYELHILNQDGKPIRTIQKKYDRLPMTADFREKYEKELAGLVARGIKLSFPDRFPAFMDISVDEKDWLWVRTCEPVEGEGDFYYFDIFDSEGKYLVKAPIRVSLDQKSVWKNNALYTIEMGGDGFQMIKRFKVIWTIPGMT